MLTRREFLTAGATAAVAPSMVGRVVADKDDYSHYSEMPDTVTLEFDEQTLNQHRPELVQSQDAREKFIGLYGWVARSEDYDTDVCVYWSSFSHQDGWIGNLDSHIGDHEPLHVEVNSETGDVERVRASIYHWIKGEVVAGESNIVDGHPRLRTIDPWHQYTATSQEGTRYEIQDLTTAFPSWLQNGLAESVAPGSSTNPWLMRGRSDWWRREYGISTNALLVSALNRAGVGEAGSLED